MAWRRKGDITNVDKLTNGPLGTSSDKISIREFKYIVEENSFCKCRLRNDVRFVSIVPIDTHMHASQNKVVIRSGDQSHCLFIVNWIPRLNQIKKIFRENAFENVVCKMSIILLSCLSVLH